MDLSRPVGGMLVGYLYGRYGEKATLALRDLAERTEFGTGKHWDGQIASLEATPGIDASAATQLLWETYHPQYYWIPILALRLISIVGFAIVGRKAEKWADLNV